MVSTRRRQVLEEAPPQPAAEPVPAQETSDESDDDAPEELSLATGKKAADSRRQAEAEAKAAARAAAKAKRTAQQERLRAAKAERQAAAAAVAGTQEDGDGQEGEEEEEEEGEALDLLPDSVVAALASTKRGAPTAEQARLITEQLRQQRQPGESLLVLGKAQREQVLEREVGPVVVRVLGAEQPSKPSQSARDFLQQRLQGGVKRSAEMLKPVRSLQPTHMALQQRRQPAANSKRRR